VLGRKIKFIQEDGASDWPTFAEKAKKLLVQDKCASVREADVQHPIIERIARNISSTSSVAYCYSGRCSWRASCSPASLAASSSPSVLCHHYPGAGAGDDLVESIAHRVTVMHQGKVLAEGDMQSVQNNPKVKEVYLGH
jgi:hypothetical protein